MRGRVQADSGSVADAAVGVKWFQLLSVGFQVEGLGGQGASVECGSCAA